MHEVAGVADRRVRASTAHAAEQNDPSADDRQAEDFEAGSIFRHFNITNFLEGDLFAWYLPVWTPAVEAWVRSLVSQLDGYNPGTLSEDPSESRDLLKKTLSPAFPA